MATNKYSLIQSITSDYLTQMLSNGTILSPKQIADDILDEEAIQFEALNAVRPKGSKMRTPDMLIPEQVADIMVALHPIAVVELAEDTKDADNKIVAMYQEDGQDEGLYVEDTEQFVALMQSYQYGLSRKDREEIMDWLKHKAPKKKLCKDINLIAVNNGIFDYEKKQLLPFDRDLVFLSKSRVNYNPQAKPMVKKESVYWL